MKYEDLLNYTPKTEEEILERLIIIRNSDPCNSDLNDECYCNICSAREDVILSYIRMIWSLANKYKMDHIEIDDLMADGILDLHRILNDKEALSRFIDDPNRGRFGNFIYSTIKFNIRSSDIRNKVASVPLRYRNIRNALPSIKRDLALKGNYDPTPRELAIEYIQLDQKNIGDSEKLLSKDEILKELDLIEKRIIRFNNNINEKTAIYWSDPIKQGESGTQSDIIGYTDPQYFEIEQENLLETIFSHLDHEEQLIIGHSFGFTVNGKTYEKLKLAEIGEILDPPQGKTYTSAKKYRIQKKIYKLLQEENLDIIPDWLHEKFNTDNSIPDSKIGLEYDGNKMDQWIKKTYKRIGDLSDQLDINHSTLCHFRKSNKMNERSRKNWIKKIGFDPIKKFKKEE